MKKIILIASAILTTSIFAEYVMKQNVQSGISFIETGPTVPVGVSQEDFDYINSITNKPNWELCYDSSSGRNITNFHTNCDNKGSTVTIVTESVSGKRVAGYSEYSWNSSSSSYTHSSSTNSVLMSLNNKLAFYPTRSSQHSIYNSFNYFPTFGGGHDLYVGHSGNITHSYCNLHSYDGWSRSYCHNGSSSTYPSMPTFEVYIVTE